MDVITFRRILRALDEIEARRKRLEECKHLKVVGPNFRHDRRRPLRGATQPGRRMMVCLLGRRRDPEPEIELSEEERRLSVEIFFDSEKQRYIRHVYRGEALFDSDEFKPYERGHATCFFEKGPKVSWKLIDSGGTWRAKVLFNNWMFKGPIRKRQREANLAIDAENERRLRMHQEMNQ